MIWTLRSLALIGSVTGTLMQCGLAQAASYDGKWSVVVVTEQGTCTAYRKELTVNHGKISERGLLMQVNGQVDQRGQLNLKLTAGLDELGATGRLSAAVGAGRWRSPTKQCSGRWGAQKQA